MRTSSICSIAAVAALAVSATVLAPAHATHKGVGAPDVRVRLPDTGAVSVLGDRVWLDMEVRCEPLEDYLTGWARLDVTVSQPKAGVSGVGSGTVWTSEHEPPCTGDWEDLTVQLRGSPTTVTTGYVDGMPLSAAPGEASASTHLYYYGYHDAHGDSVYGRAEDHGPVQLQHRLTLS